MCERGVLKIRIWQTRRWRCGFILVLAGIFLPFAYSRIASPWRSVAVHSIPDRTEADPLTDELRVACYNIAHGRGLAESNWDGGDAVVRRTRLDNISDLLREIDADIVVLNEVDFDASWSNSTNQAQYLAEKAGYSYWVEQRNVDFRILFRTWRFGNAVLSKYPVKAAQLVELPGYSAWETVMAGKKQGIVCDMAIGDRVVRVLGTHLSHRSESVRVKSARVITEIAAASDVPIIVAGDLNSAPPGFPESDSDRSGNNAIQILDRSVDFQRTPMDVPVTSQALTYHSVEATQVIDWILIPRDWRYIEYVVDPSQLSDHRPVYTDAALQ